MTRNLPNPANDSPLPRRILPALSRFSPLLSLPGGGGRNHLSRTFPLRLFLSHVKLVYRLRVYATTRSRDSIIDRDYDDAPRDFGIKGAT